MKLLVLGGTRFLGRHLVEIARVSGHTLTLFHRGTGGCTLFPDVEHVHGDRDGELGKLAGGRWDAVIDTSGYFPRVVRASAEALAGSAGRYVFVSSISVYPRFFPGMAEDAPVAELADPSVEEITETTYGGLKVLCERAVESVFPGRALVVRSGLIVGPYDPTDRFTYWVRRVAAGGRILVPAPPERPTQFIHAGDLAGWMLRAAEAGVAGVMNATGPAVPHPLSEVLETCREASGGKAEWVWASEPFLLERKVEFWSELPVCVSQEGRGVMEVNVDRAVAAGLSVRPLLRTIRETLAWDAGRPPGTTLKAGLAPARERELLAAWDAATR